MYNETPPLSMEAEENEEIPVFKEKLKISDDFTLLLEHRNHEAILKIELISKDNKKIGLKKYLPLPKNIEFGIGNDFYVEKRRHFPEKINIPSIKEYLKFKDINSPFEYLLLLFHEFGHVNGKGLETKKQLDEFYEQHPNAINIFHLPSEIQKQGLILTNNAEIEAWNFAINQIKAIELENKIKILPENNEVECIINKNLDDYRQRYNNLLTERNNNLFVISLQNDPTTTFDQL